MIYVSENHSCVIDSDRRSAVLESVGFKTKGEYMVGEKKKVVKKSTLEKINSAVSNVLGSSETTRTSLMLEVQRCGIKNFRVMNKEELGMIVAGATPQQIEAIQLAAVTRWKAGFGKGKKNG